MAILLRKLRELPSMIEKQSTDRWNLCKARKPEIGKVVLIGPVDGAVTFGQWNEMRNLWFSGDRPVFPKWWRPMPRLPKMKVKADV